MHWPKTEARCKSSGQATKLEHRRFPAVLSIRPKSLRSAGLRLIRFRALAKIHFPSEAGFDRIGPILGRGESQVSSKALFTPSIARWYWRGGPSSMSFRPPFFRAEDSWPRSARMGREGVSLLGTSIYLQFKSLVILVTSWPARKLGNEYRKSTLFPGR